jgi:hypothetical protein
MFEVLNVLLKLLVTCNGNYYIIIPVKHEYVVQKVEWLHQTNLFYTNHIFTAHNLIYSSKLSGYAVMLDLTSLT